MRDAVRRGELRDLATHHFYQHPAFKLASHLLSGSRIPLLHSALGRNPASRIKEDAAPNAPAPFPPRFTLYHTPFGVTMRLHVRAMLCALLLIAAASPRPAQAQSHAQSKLSLEQYLDWVDVQTPQLSPDGAQIIYTRRWIDKMNDKWETT